MQFSVIASPSARWVGSADLGCDIRTMPQEQARALLGVEDDFIKGLSPFDRSARMKTDREVAPEQFLKFVAASALDWKPEEQRAVEAAIKAIAPTVAKLNLKFPKSVLMVKTTGKEEGRASYTRRNAIILPQNFLSSGRGGLEHTVAHELFHILTRNCPELRDVLYATIGFLPCNEIELPGELKARKITNPDAPRNDHYIRVSSDGKQVSVVPILYSAQPKYDVKRGGEFLEYMLARLLVVEKQQDEWRPVRRNGQATCLEETQVSQFLEQVGKNTEFTYHPEEILADNFALIVTGRKNLPSAEVAAKLDRLLRSATLPYATSAEPATASTKASPVAFDAHDGYFVSNKFEPQAPASFVVLQDEKAFDQVFGVAMVMGDRSHRLPPRAFEPLMVVAPIKRGKVLWRYTVESVRVDGGVLTLRYTTTASPSATAEYACPLIVSVPKGAYTAVEFVEDGKVIKKVELAAPPP